MMLCRWTRRLLRANRPRRSILSIGDCTIYAQFGSTANKYSRTRKYWNSPDCCGEIRWACSPEGEPPRRPLVSSHERLLIRTVESFGRLAASANASDLAVDVRIFLI